MVREVIALPEDPREVRCISLWEPWASLWCSGVKLHETRGWPTGYRGPLFVHAAKRWNGDLKYMTADLFRAIEQDPRLVARFRPTIQHGRLVPPDSAGCIVGAVTLDACYRTTSWVPASLDRLCGNWDPGRWAWRASEHALFPDPIPCRGAQGFWTPPEDVLERAVEMLRAA